MAKTLGEILVLAAHPDDEVLGCGGTLLKWRDAGHPILVAFGGEGRVGGSQAKDAGLVADKAGWKILSWGGNVDNEFHLRTTTLWIEELLKHVRPFRILIHESQDTNQDHRIMREASLISCRPWATAWKPPLGSVREILGFEVPGSSPLRGHTTYVDISSHLVRKSALISLYLSENRVATHPRSVEAIGARAAMYGSASGLAMAEPFTLEFMAVGPSSGVHS